MASEKKVQIRYTDEKKQDTVVSNLKRLQVGEADVTQGRDCRRLDVEFILCAMQKQGGLYPTQSRRRFRD
jgi:hypothetical protein